MLITNPGVQAYLVKQILLHDNVSGYLVHGLIHQLILVTIDTILPCVTTPVLIIDADRKTIPFHQAERLIKQETRIMIVRIKQIRIRRPARIIPIINLMMAPVVESTKGTTCLPVIIL